LNNYNGPAGLCCCMDPFYAVDMAGHNNLVGVIKILEKLNTFIGIADVYLSSYLIQKP
jgi:hypothetical protein